MKVYDKFMDRMTAFSPGGNKGYDYSLKFLLVGDSDVGKNEILDLLETEEDQQAASSSQFQFCTQNSSVLPRTALILLEGKRVKLQIWDTSGQGRFATIIRSYSRGAQGILVVYDITNRWSFEGITRWLKEVEEHAPGIPKILVGNRLHLEFRRQVSREYAENFARKKKMEYLECSTLANFNIHESLTELSRVVLNRNGMERLWKSCKVPTLQECCCRVIVRHLPTAHDMDRLPVPTALQLTIKSYARGSQLTATLPRHHRRTNSSAELLYQKNYAHSCGSLRKRHAARLLAPFRRMAMGPSRAALPGAGSSRDAPQGNSACANPPQTSYRENNAFANAQASRDTPQRNIACANPPQKNCRENNAFTNAQTSSAGVDHQITEQLEAKTCAKVSQNTSDGLSHSYCAMERGQSSHVGNACGNVEDATPARPPRAHRRRLSLPINGEEDEKNCTVM